MNILHILTDLTPFNAWVVVGALGKAGEGQPVKIHVVYLSSREEPKFPLDHIQRSSVLTYDPHTDFDPNIHAGLKKYIADNHIGHIHVHDSMSMRYVSGWKYFTQKKYLHFYRNERVFKKVHAFLGFHKVIHLTESS
ncbi:MAG: hypothetical protein KC713_07200, partial [Candidatus Omnitrophica bacterium]|nr:hypothetical protein [Candidatus Omnitrophota bacterium]